MATRVHIESSNHLHKTRMQQFKMTACIGACLVQLITSTM
ncbi:hypothetical protein LINPERPRIM_LOCUS8585 [Linum perenne]